MWPLSRARAAKLNARPEPLPPIIVVVDGETVGVTLRRHAKARRMVLRQSRDGSSFVLTVPHRVSRRAAEDFLHASREWMGRTIARLPAVVTFEEARTIQLRGETFAVSASGRLRGLVTVDEEGRLITVPGAPVHIKRRLADWLKEEARKDLLEASQRYAAAMDVSIGRLGVRDPRSRWGSCNSDGSLSYSWRLIMAPPMVLDYVAAHEVAHLREMNHGPRFWKLVLGHCASARAAKTWLKQHGQALHRLL